MRVCGVLGGIGLCAAAHAGPSADHTGTSVEAELGVGYAHSACHDSGCASSAYPLLTLGGSLGWWVAPRFALQLRVFDVTRSFDHLILCGPGFQYWPSERVWIGAATGADTYVGAHNTAVTVGFDFRVGVVAVASGAHAVTVSAEVSPAVTDDNLTSFALLLGYQHL